MAAGAISTVAVRRQTRHVLAHSRRAGGGLLAQGCLCIDQRDPVPRPNDPRRSKSAEYAKRRSNCGQACHDLLEAAIIAIKRARPCAKAPSHARPRKPMSRPASISTALASPRSRPGLVSLTICWSSSRAIRSSTSRSVPRAIFISISIIRSRTPA